LQRLGKREQELGIRVEGNSAIIELQPGDAEKREAYEFLAAVVQGEVSGRGNQILRIPAALQNLSKEFPGLEETFKVLRGGKSCLPDEDLTILQLYLVAYYGGLRNKSGLFHWRDVISAGAVR